MIITLTKYNLLWSGVCVCAPVEYLCPNKGFIKVDKVSLSSLYGLNVRRDFFRYRIGAL